MATEYLYPDGVISYQNFNDGGGGTTNMHLDVDDTHGTVTTSNYVQNGPGAPVVGDYIEFSLGNKTMSNVATAEMHVSFGDWASGRTHNFDIQLREGTTVRKTWNLATNVNDNTVEQTYALTSGEIATISNWDDLRFRIIHQENVGAGPDATAIFTIHLQIGEKHALTSTGAGRLDGTATGVLRKGLGSTGAGRLDATASGSAKKPLTSTAGGRLDATAVGSGIRPSGRGILEATAIGEVVSGGGGTNHPISSTGASRLDATSLGGRVAALSSSGASRLDATSLGTRIARLSSSGPGRLDATSLGSRIVPLSSSGASRLDATSLGSRVVFVSSSGAGRLDATATGAVYSGAVNHALGATGGARLDATATANFLFKLSSTGPARLDATGQGIRLVALASTGGGRLDATSLGSKVIFVSALGGGRLDSTAIGTRVMPLASTGSARLDGTATGIIESFFPSIVIQGATASAAGSLVAPDIELSSLTLGMEPSEAKPEALVEFVTQHLVLTPDPAAASLTTLLDMSMINIHPSILRKLNAN